MQIIAPEVYKVMVENRDIYMARAINEVKEDEVVAVVGLAHCKGIIDIMTKEYNYKSV